MPPPEGSDSISRPRAVISSAADDRSSTPATCAAATSPMEWPATKDGSTPSDSSRRKVATSTAKIAGWVKAVRSSSRASSPSGSAQTTSSRGRGSRSFNAAAASSNAARQTG
ncbi:hypothetical protein Mame01_49790 [Microbispora amethystogenes]|nr:hypothetical protein Mame01_49790 [Microbispora amethystogenes]